MNIATLLFRAGRSHGDRPALALGRHLLADYATLAERVARLAGGLLAFGLEPGERVALVMTNHPSYVEALFAIWHAGLAAVPVNAKLHPQEIGYILDHSDARLCLASPDLADSLVGLEDSLDGLEAVMPVGGGDLRRMGQAEAIPLQPRQPDDLAWLFYTSGTTGKPKGAMLGHRNLLAMTTSYFVDVDGISPEDAILHAAPMSHGSGLYILPHVAAAAAQVVPESGGFDPEEILDLLQVWRGVSIFAAPTMLRRLVDHPATATTALAGLKTIVYGGGPMYTADLQRARQVLGPGRLVQIYGQGESPMTITALSKHHHDDSGHPRWEQRLASVGIPHTVVEVRVADADDQPLPAGTLGEVLVRGETVMAGYWKDGKASIAALRNGWLHTGDIGMLDAEGFLFLKDRSKDVIISGGSNIYPREVEEVLLRHPAVAEVAVVGLPHADWGEEVVAVVVAMVADQPPPEAELDALCLASIARFKRPKRYVFVPALPKNNYGKVLKTQLRDTVTPFPSVHPLQRPVGAG